MPATQTDSNDAGPVLWFAMAGVIVVVLFAMFMTAHRTAPAPAATPKVQPLCKPCCPTPLEPDR